MNLSFRSIFYSGPRVVTNLFSVLIFIASPARPLLARLTEHLTDQQMLGKADLVVVARFVSTRETDERATLAGIEPSINAIGVTSEFEVCLVIKGERNITKFQLHHYRADEDFTNGPLLLAFPKNGESTYLLFLIKEKDGRYMPATGQTDPSGSSVFQLRGTNQRGFAAAAPAAVCREDKGLEPRSSAVQLWTYRRMLENADVVVIADWRSAVDTIERVVMPYPKFAFKLIGAEIEFEVSLVLTGQNDIREVRLHHYRYENEAAAGRGDGPKLVRIPAPVHGEDRHEYPGGGRFLLFLKKESDGRYAPVTGQVEPALYSVLQLLLAAKSD